MKHVGFTGSQKGMSPMQLKTLQLLLSLMKGSITLHHGDCIGADEQAHDAALMVGMRIVIHPPTDNKKRAFCEGANVVLDPLPYLVRNLAIVVASQWMIATPGGPEIVRSGTWATVRMARQLSKPVVIL